MKLLFIIISITCLSFSAGAQIDSGKVVLNNVVVKAKDLAYIKVFLDNSNRYEKIDSLINSVYRTTNPGNNNDVTISGVERRVWRGILNLVYLHPAALQNEVYKRFKEALVLTSDVWIVDKIAKDEAGAKTTDYDPLVDTGKKMARNEID